VAIGRRSGSPPDTRRSTAVRILVLVVGRLKDGPERDLTARYLDRARAAGRSLGLSPIDLVEVAESRAARAADRKAEERAVLRERIGSAGLVALDERAPSRSSEDFARMITQRRDAGLRDAAFVIGGPDGLDPALLQSADETVSFGRMTLPHQLVRVLLCEQIYRATTILSGHPYHRA
jgi:23S rRNA (pseudouridine1915-N3)-methyltransferase